MWVGLATIQRNSNTFQDICQHNTMAIFSVGRLKQIFCGHISLLILCKISKLRFKRAMTNMALIRSHIISLACFFSFGKESAVVFRALFTFRACQKCTKMIYRKLMIIGSNVTVGWQLVPQGNSVCLGAFGKMSGSHCRHFRPSPYPLPLLLILPLFRSFPNVRERLEKEKKRLLHRLIFWSHQPPIPTSRKFQSLLCREHGYTCICTLVKKGIIGFLQSFALGIDKDLKFLTCTCTKLSELITCFLCYYWYWQ